MTKNFNNQLQVDPLFDIERYDIEVPKLFEVKKQGLCLMNNILNKYHMFEIQITSNIQLLESQFSLELKSFDSPIKNLLFVLLDMKEVSWYAFTLLANRFLTEENIEFNNGLEEILSNQIPIFTDLESGLEKIFLTLLVKQYDFVPKNTYNDVRNNMTEFLKNYYDVMELQDQLHENIKSYLKLYNSPDFLELDNTKKNNMIIEQSNLIFKFLRKMFLCNLIK